jgi:hypothetical protein
MHMYAHARVDILGMSVRMTPYTGTDQQSSPEHWPTMRYHYTGVYIHGAFMFGLQAGYRIG